MSELCNRTSLVQQKKLPNVPKHCNANDQKTVIIHKTVHIFLFMCMSNSLFYMSNMIICLLLLLFLCKHLIFMSRYSSSLRFKFCGGGRREKLYSIYLRICLFPRNSSNISISFSSDGTAKTPSLFAPRSHLVLYRNRRNVR